jgi:hypothetical protein
LGSHSPDSLPRHIREPRQVQLVCHRYIRGRTISVLAQNNIGFTAPGIFPIECIGAMQKHYHIRILFK